MFQLNNSQLDDLKQIAVCQIACFPKSFNTVLGNKFISKSLGWFLASEKRFLFHINIGKEVVGFCGGFAPQFYGDGSSSGMLQFAFKEAIIGVLKKPWIIFDHELRTYYPFILKNIKRKIGFTKVSATNPIPTNYIFKSTVGLVVIGVHPDYRGKGIFEMLMNEFENRAKQLQINECVLSVRSNNDRAIAAYKKMGWIIKEGSVKALIMHKHI
jgi:hypothetical protein